MDRRRLLHGLSCGLGLGLAGCATPPLSDAREPTVNRLEESTVTAFDDWLFADAVEEATGATTLVQVGSSADSHWVIVFADTARPIDVTITISRADREPFYTETVAISTDTYAGFRLMASGPYTVSIASDVGGGDVAVADDFIDCNDSYQLIRLQSDGELSESSLTEEVACGG